MAITTGDVQSVQNYFAMNELNTNLSALATSLQNIPGVYKKLGKDLENYATIIANVKVGTSYGDLTSVEKDTFEQVNVVLKNINDTIKKSRANETKRAKDNNRQPNQKLFSSLDQMKRSVILSSASIRAYYKASNVKGRIKTGLGDKESNIEASKVSAQMINNQRGAAQATSDAITNLAESYKLSPTSNLSLPPKDLSVDTSNKGSRRKKEAKETLDSILPPYFGGLANGLSSLAKGLTSMVSSISQFGGALGTAYSAIMSGIGDMLDDPFSGTISIIKGLSSLVSSAMSLISSIFDSIFNFITSILGSGDKDDDGEGGTSSVISNIFSAVFSLISSLLTMAIQAIQSGFQMFTSTLETALKLVKKIALSSPIVKAILELLNLAFTLFFMPFMNSFALVLLPYVLSLLEWATIMGNTFSELGTTVGNTLLSILTSDTDIKDTFIEMVDTFVEDLLPDFMELIPSLTDFALDFVENILNNSEDIISFLKKGFEAFSAMMDAGILGTFLDIGNKTMEWLKDNAPELVQFIAVVMTGLLKIASFFTKMIGNQTDVPVANSHFVDSVTDLGSTLAESLTGDSSVDPQNLSGSPITAGTGGIFRPMNGGIPVLTAEAGEGEFQLTDAELREIGKDTTVSIQYNGMVLSRNDFKNTVRQTMTDISTKSYYR